MNRGTFHKTRFLRALSAIDKSLPWINVDQKLQAGFLDNQILDLLKYEQLLTKKN